MVVGAWYYYYREGGNQSNAIVLFKRKRNTEIMKLIVLEYQTGKGEGKETLPYQECCSVVLLKD
ncbi:19710_t:CDS:2 [Dentiscutata erythropus]|uniref:19710_t:CDS:1 n=1 Tax=Dentiscutata erythropus TaxID=1348616 RepID=A0A9N8YZ12_9GLOM|nr:19710_t:CDS:2 [Dentiscutata erythropus]